MALLIVCVGALSVAGAAIGRGLETFGIDDVTTHIATAAPVLAADAPLPLPTADPTPPLPSQQERGAGGASQSMRPALQSPVPAGGVQTPILAVAPFPPAGPVAAAIPMRLPQTAGGPEILALAVVALALCAAGMALRAAPRLNPTRRDKRSRD